MPTSCIEVSGSETNVQPSGDAGTEHTAVCFRRLWMVLWTSLIRLPCFGCTDFGRHTLHRDRRALSGERGTCASDRSTSRRRMDQTRQRRLNVTHVAGRVDHLQPPLGQAWVRQAANTHDKAQGGRRWGVGGWAAHLSMHRCMTAVWLQE